MWRDDHTDSMQYGRLAQLNPIKAPCRQMEGPLTAQLPSYMYTCSSAAQELYGNCMNVNALRPDCKTNGFTQNGRVGTA